LHLLNCLQINSADEQTQLSYLWGRLNCELYQGLYDDARETFKYLKNKLDSDNFFSSTHSFYQVFSRAQFVHALLYFISTNEKVTEADLEYFMEIAGSEHYFAVIQMVAPFLFRYLITTPLLSRNYFTYGNYGINWLLNALQ